MPPRAIQPLEDRADLRPGLPEFHRLAGQMLGIAATDSDGFRPMFSEASAGFAFGSPAFQSIDPLLNQSQAAAKDVVEDTLAVETQLLSRNVETGRQILRDSNAVAGVGNPLEDEQPAGQGTPTAVAGTSAVVRLGVNSGFRELSPEVQ